MKNKDDKKKVRQAEIKASESYTALSGNEESIDSSADSFLDPDIDSELSVAIKRQSTTTLDDLTEIDPDLLSGKVQNTGKKSHKKIAEGKKYTKNDVAEVELNLESSPLESSEVLVSEDGLKSKRKSHGLFFIVLTVIALLAVVAGILFFEGGMDQKLQSPLTVHGKQIDSAEFSFMYHYEMIHEGVDLFAADTAKMLSMSYTDDENYATYRDYFLNCAAEDIQEMEILYDDATANGYRIESKHYDLARSYINWLQTSADELGVSLDTYIKGVFGKQVDEQVVLNVLAKKYFTEDYATGAKLVELSASEEQANTAYNENTNAYDLVSYKILRITYEQREQAFIDTANLHAQQIIDEMGTDTSTFESVAAQYFSGVAAEMLQEEDSTLVPDCRYDDITHDNFRDWLFDSERTPGDATIIEDEDGFPIILVFVKRDRMATPLRDVYIMHVSAEINDDGTTNIAGAQALAQEVYDYIENENSCEQIENIFNDNVLNGTLTVSHSESSYLYQYDEDINDWIFDSSRELGNKALMETTDGFYVMYFISESNNPEWYDRVNSFIRMTNYQAFLDEKAKEYTYSFNEEGLSHIQDIP